MGQQMPMNPDGSPVKRRPGRPKGSTKKNLLAGSPVPPKIKRPVGSLWKGGYPAGSVGSRRTKRERTQAPAVRVFFLGKFLGIDANHNRCNILVVR